MRGQGRKSNATSRKQGQRGAACAACSEAGFTVLEFLVALAMFALVVTILFGNVHFGLRAWRAGSAQAQTVDQNITVQGLLRRIVAQAYPLFLSTDLRHGYVAFEGGRESLQFLARAPAVMGAGGHFRYSLLLDQFDKRSNLILETRPELADPSDNRLVEKSMLLRDIDRLEISYLGASPGTIQWQENWRRQTELPRLVRIRVDFRAGDKRRWPDLVVAPRIFADVGCILDPLTTRCRGR